MKNPKSGVTRLQPAHRSKVDFPFEESVGYQVRAAHRSLQRFLQVKIEPYGVTLGMWYLLRALWHEDGLTQRELSRRIGIMEPTTLAALNGMERRGLVRRVRSKTDRRKWHVRLTPKAQELKAQLIPLARDVVNTAVAGVTPADVEQLLKLLGAVQQNIASATNLMEEVEAS
jgi:MarR family transcriptional regulator, organic hydroperoxide resistance regulator